MRSEKITRENLGSEIARMVEAKFPPERIIYIKANSDTKYERIVEIMKFGREAEEDDYGLIVTDKTNTNDVPGSLNIKIHLEEFNEKDTKSDSVGLIVTVEGDGKIKLNSKPETSSSLAVKLRNIFQQRKQKRVFRLGSREEIEKTVLIKAPLSAKFGDLVTVIEIIKNTGADPIGLLIDKLPE
ncbi:MAG: biopolymer transporter ExbD [Acidobacteriota bacterium]|nr:biopolymer transporter ExbD [Acidobacteriota bacterium]